MKIKKRNAWLWWFGLFLTFGQLSYLWIFLLARDVNRIHGAEKIRVRLHAPIFGALWLIYVVSFLGMVTNMQSATGSPGMPPAMFFLLFNLAACLTVYSIILIARVAVLLRQKSPQMLAPVIVVLLSCVLAISLPILQIEMNKIADAA